MSPIQIRILEIRNPKQIQKAENPKSQRSIYGSLGDASAFSCFRISDLFRISSFGFRIFASLFAVALLLLPTPVRAAPSVTASLNPDTAQPGQAAELKLVFEGGAPPQHPPIPAVNGLTIQPSGVMRQFSIDNGVSHSSQIYSYQVMAVRPGDYLIPPVQITVDGVRLTTPPLKFKVVKATAAGAGPAEPAFFKLIVPKTEVFVGEMFPVELQLYLAVDGENLQMPQLKGDGFVFGKMPQPAQLQTALNNRPYHLIVFKMSAVAVKAGNLELGPAECSLTLHLPRQGRRDFFGLFNSVDLKPQTVLSEPAAISVLPLPRENQPADFTGAIGSYTLSARASPTKVSAGDPVTVEVQISGKGVLDSITLPSLTNWSGFKLYPPNTKVDFRDSLGMEGVKTFEQVAIPQTSAIREIPALSFSYFDPEAKTYRTLRENGIRLAVEESPVHPAPAGLPALPSDTPAKGADEIVHIKNDFGALATAGLPLVRRPWFLVSQAIPLLGWLAALFWRRRQDDIERNPYLRRRRAAAVKVALGLRELRSLAQAGAQTDFFALAFRLLQEEIGALLDLPSSAITDAVVEQRLRPLGIPEELLAEVRDLFQQCNQARYAHDHQAMVAMEAVLEKLNRVLADLDRRVPARAAGRTARPGLAPLP